jgi:hypothetical protein
MAWNIDYERDSEEVIHLKRQIAEQGCWRLRLFYDPTVLIYILSLTQTTVTRLSKVN